MGFESRHITDSQPQPDDGNRDVDEEDPLPAQGVNKDAADLQPLAAPATNAGEPLVVQWKPAAKNSAWKHMNVSLVALLANGKQHETSLAHGIDGTDPTNNTLHAKAPKHVHGDSTQYLIKFSDGQDEKKSPKFVIRENKASKLHSRRNSESGISKEQIDSIVQEMLGSGERDSDDSGSSTGHGSPTAAINRIPSAASSSLVSKASSKHKPITISGVTYYPKIDSTSKSKSKSKGKGKSRNVSLCLQWIWSMNMNRNLSLKTNLYQNMNMNMNMSMSTTMYTNTSPYTKGSQSLIPRLILALDLTAEVKWMTSSILACRIYLLMIPSRERRHRRRLIPNQSALDAHPS